jgi:mono/diheme cytochrome c family protein
MLPVMRLAPAFCALLLPTVTPAADRGQALYEQHCASCHGRNLEGQPDWQRRGPDGLMPAPPHDASGHTWHHSDDQLFLITKRGISALVPNYKSAMPAFEAVLSDEEIRAVLSYIKSKWPREEAEFQRQRSQ